MPDPKADPPGCDVPGCGNRATHSTDGSEKDSQDRKALANINVCDHHENWPFSEDARLFALSDKYRRRK
jgi:hypothetical protein